MKNIILPVGLLVGLLIVLGIATLMLTGTITDKDAKLTDMNTSVKALINDNGLLLAENTSVKTNYNNLLSTHNVTVASLTAAQGQVTDLTTTTASLTLQNNSLTIDLNKAKFDYNTLFTDGNKMRYDYNILLVTKNNLVIDNNKLVFDYNILGIDRNNLFSIKNDLNARGHRLYLNANNCYWAIKCSDLNNTVCALKYGYGDINSITGNSTTASNQAQYVLRPLCTTSIDSNIGDYNYFS